MDNDSCTEDGARKLKAKIEEYWAERGFSVSIKLVEVGFVPLMRSVRTDVRSNMVNGMPPRKEASRVPKPAVTPMKVVPTHQIARRPRTVL